MRPLQQRVSALPQWNGCHRLLPGAAVAAPPIVPSRMLTATITPIRRDGQSRHGWHYQLLGVMSISLYCCSSEPHPGSRLARTPALPLTRQPTMPTAGRLAGKWSPPDLGPEPLLSCPAVQGLVRFQDQTESGDPLSASRARRAKSQRRPTSGGTQLRQAAVKPGQVPTERH